MVKGDSKARRLHLTRFEEAYQILSGKSFNFRHPSAQRFLSIFGQSSALAEKLIRNASWADDFMSDPDWERQKSKEELRRELDDMIHRERPNDIVSWQRCLRHFKYRQMIRIAARDLHAKSGAQEILCEWSDVADVIIDKTYEVSMQISTAQFGEPSIKLPDKTSKNCTGTIIALGKLGSRELNMSSDIDLLCLYASDDGETSGGAKSKLTNHEFFAKLVTLLTRLLSELTEDGFAFRCDHDLRPEGPKGPLVNSIDAAERYYETFGRDWERQAMIRARPVGGDISLGERFIESVAPFVYRRSLSFGDLSHLKEMKEQMEAEYKGGNLCDNIKIGRGGIRELEFIVQGFQQVFGGHIKNIRTPNTFTAIEALERHHLIHPHAAKTLHESYAFLRRLENMVQIADDQQTHVIPRDESELEGLARRMGINDAADMSAQTRLSTEWRRRSQMVHSLFTGLFGADYERLELEEAIRANLETCESDEEKIDSLPWFKHQETRRLAHLDLNSKLTIQELLRRLSLVAEVVLETALNLAFEQISRKFGRPMLENGAPASFAIIGLGRLGSREIDYGSDLDLCFIYSGDGATKGPEIISNGEFFTKLAQRIISLVCLNSRYGRAYLIDSELRPSGRQGSLVATLESFRDYHQKKAQIWERQALLKARVIAGDEAFMKEVKITLIGLAYKAAPPDEKQMLRSIADLRYRFEAQGTNERMGVYNLKIGSGGIADIEAIMQSLQLKYAHNHTELWAQNGFELLQVLYKISALSYEYYDVLLSSYKFYRLLIARLRLFTNSATDLLNLEAPYANSLSSLMGFSSPEELKKEIEIHRKKNRDLYNGHFTK